MSRKIPELLAPAGGPAELNAAVAAGADAVYCGYGNVFNARRGAQTGKAVPKEKQERMKQNETLFDRCRYAERLC